MTSKIFGTVIVPLSILLPLCIGTIRYQKLTASGKICYSYLIVSAIFTSIALLIGRYFHKNSLPISHLFTFVELSTIVLFYKKLFNADTKNDNRLYYGIIIGFTLLCILNAVFFQSIYTYNSYTKSIEAIICILFAMKYFASIASGNNSSAKVFTSPDFYFNAAFFQYFSGGFMLFVFSNFIITNLSNSDFNIIWTIHATLVLIMYLIFSVTFTLCKK
jgi:hypothetical protein